MWFYSVWTAEPSIPLLGCARVSSMWQQVFQKYYIHIRSLHESPFLKKLEKSTFPTPLNIFLHTLKCVGFLKQEYC